MVGGAGYAAGRSAARGAQRESDQEARLQELEAQAQAGPPPAAAPAAPPAAGGTDIASKLVELKGLLDQGVLTPEEFEAAKRQLLAT